MISRMPARERERVELKCPSCGRTGFANVAVGSERKTASASGFLVKIIDIRNLEIVCPDCTTVVLQLE